jgi:hypothetical protein
MKVNEIISEAFGEGFADSPYGENHAAEIERGRMRDEMSADFQNERTPVTEFDLDEIKRIVMPAARGKPEVKRQVDEVMAAWQEMFDEDSYIEDDVFNKTFKAYEALKDSQESPLIKFNKMHAITKEVKDAADAFEAWESSEGGDRWKDEKGHFGQ